MKIFLFKHYNTFNFLKSLVVQKMNPASNYCTTVLYRGGATWHTSNGDVIRGEGEWRWGDPLGGRLPRGVEHEVCEGEGAVVNSQQSEAPVIFPRCSFHLQQSACHVQAVRLQVLQHSTAQHSTAQHSTAQYSMTPMQPPHHSTAQHSLFGMAQHSTGPLQRSKAQQRASAAHDRTVQHCCSASTAQRQRSTAQHETSTAQHSVV